MRIPHDRILTYIDSRIDDIIELRHTLHAAAELAGEERQTRALLKQRLEGGRFILWQPKLGTDLIAELPGRDPGRVIGFRSDMDGLPIRESTGADYASEHEGIMHACGHDGHMAILAGAAMVLADMQEYLPCTLRFIFQPGEEVACLGAQLAAAGACDGLERIYGFHNWPSLPVGSVSSKSGILFAAANTFSAVIHGKATHGAVPEKGNNPLIPAAFMTMRIQELHTRLQEDSRGVASVCMLSGGKNSNVIPASMEMAGTTRYTDTKVGDMIEQEIRQIVSDAESRYGVTIELSYERSYHLPVINDAEAVEELKEVVDLTIGAGAYIPAERHVMTAEDFSFYLDRVPGCMFLLGAGESSPVLHAADFDFNDDIIRQGIYLICALAMREVID